jgi:hypothetical protein
MDLLYFDFDHGVERLLFIRLDQQSRVVHFRLEKGPDQTHDEESEEVLTATISDSTNCSDDAQFAGFCRALIEAMRDTPFSLQDPTKTPFAAISQGALSLEGIGEGVSPERLTCRIPSTIAAELVGPDRMTERFKPLI